jgi:cyclic pyranopterin phosphate synthase
LRAGADDDELSRIIRNTWTAREDRYSEQRVVLRQRAAGQKVEMNYIGG